MKGFSFAAVILSYLLVAGGMFVGLLIGGFAQIQSSVVVYLLMAAGSFVGGFVAARASRGSTIIEPAIGAILLIGSVVALAAETEIGQLIWHVAQGETMKFIGIVGALGAGGAIVGAFLSEKLFGDATESALPWLLYSAMATFGATVIATGAMGYFASRGDGNRSDAAVASVMLLGLGAGCLLAGLAIGASARVRPLIASLIGGAVGVGAFLYLIVHLAGELDSKAAAGLAIFTAGGGIVTLIGTAIGWAVVGKRASAMT